MKWSNFYFIEKLSLWSLGFMELLTIKVSWQDTTGWCKRGIKIVMCSVCQIRHWFKKIEIIPGNLSWSAINVFPFDWILLKKFMGSQKGRGKNGTSRKS